MKELINKIRPYLIFILLILFTIPSFYSLLRSGFFPMQDDLQAFRIYEMDKCFSDRQFPCRFVPDAGYQYSYPQFNYYPPSVYYLGEVIHLLGFQIIDAVKILFILGYLFGAITMFILLRSIFGEFPALIGALLYTYTPYKAVEVYVRGAMNEFWAFVFFPLIFWSIYMLIKTNKLKYFLWLSFSTGLLLLTHNLMAMIFSPLAFIWSIFWLWEKKDFRKIINLASGVLLGVGLAAFFTLPVIFEGKYVHLESMLGGYFDYRQHFADINQLFISSHWGYGSSYLGPGDDLSLSTGIVQWILAMIAGILSLIFFKKQKKIALLVWVLIILDLIVLFMIHQKSTFIWEKIPQLWYLQFPWRFLSDSVFLLAIIDTAAIYLCWNKKVAYSLGIAVVILAMILNVTFFKPEKWIDLTDDQKFSGNLWEKQLTISIFDYLPIFATLPPWQKAPDLPEILEGKASFSDYQKGSNYQQGKINVTEDALLRLPFFDFPGMEVLVNNKKITFWHNDCREQKYCLGLVTFRLPKGEYFMKAEINNTPVRLIGNIISFLSWSILIILSIKLIYERKN